MPRNAARPRAYLDYNASAPLRPEARTAMHAALDLVGNPSSVHAEGRAARAVIEEARTLIAALVGASPRGVVFTSGATEAAALALTPSLAAAAGRDAPARLIVAGGEHPAVRLGHRFPAAAVETVKLSLDGVLDLSALERLLPEDDASTPILALQGANNETGAIQPVAEAARLVHRAGGLVVCDAVQLAGREPADLKALGADFALLSAHKLGGPKGVGALVASQAEMLPPALLRGGGQERSHRAGTENVAGVAGFGAAAAAALGQAAVERERLKRLRNAFEAELLRLAPEAVIFALGAPRLANTSSFAIPGTHASTLLIALDLEGVAASSGAACSSGKVAPSHVLASMGVSSELAQAALRVSLGWGSGQEDVSRLVAALAAALARRQAAATASGPSARRTR